MTIEKSHIKVNSIETTDGSPVIVSFGATIPSGYNLEVNGNASLIGTTTAISAVVTNFSSSGIITANQFYGDGSQLSSLPVITPAKTVALLIIS